VRIAVSGGMSVPTGEFSDYHDLGIQASASAIIRLFGQKIRIRPELLYSRFEVAEEKVRELVATLQLQQERAMPTGVQARRDALRGPHLLAVQGASRDLKVPDLEKVRDSAISSLLGTFANVELPLGPGAFQSYIIGGIGAVTTVDVWEAGASAQA